MFLTFHSQICKTATDKRIIHANNDIVTQGYTSVPTNNWCRMIIIVIEV